MYLANIGFFILVAILQIAALLQVNVMYRVVICTCTSYITQQHNIYATESLFSTAIKLRHKRNAQHTHGTTTTMVLTSYVVVVVVVCAVLTRRAPWPGHVSSAVAPPCR